MDSESTAQPSELGMEYQFLTITDTAARLSNNEHVKNFVIYSNIEDAKPLDDMILKIWFNSEKYPHVYACQVKHTKTESVNISDTPTKREISRYLEVFKTMETSKERFPFLDDIPDDEKHHIKFWVFTNQNVEDVNVYHETTSLFQCEFSEITYAHRTIIPFETRVGCCKKLSFANIQVFQNVSSVTPEEYKNLFSKLYLLLNQRSIEEVRKNIKKYCELPESASIYRYIHKYFNTPELARDGLSKETFQTKLLVELLDYWPPFTMIEICSEEAHVFNELVNEHDVTLVDKIENIQDNIYSCLLQRINRIFRKDFAWTDIVSEDGHFIEDTVSKEFREYAEKMQFRRWLTEPVTISDLFVELCVYGELPLILKTDSELKTILSKYKHLKKKFIIIGDVEKKLEELSPHFPKILTNVADIKNISLRDKLLGCVKVSLQGKTPTSLSDIMCSNELAMKELTCFEILRLIKKRKAYLDEKCLSIANSIIFIIEDGNSQEWNIEEISSKSNENIKIYCRDINEIPEHMKKNCNFENYSACYLRSLQGRLEFIGGDMLKLKDYFVDENNDGVYIDCNNQKVLPIIGQKLCRKLPVYLPRYLSEARALRDSSQDKRIYFVSGDINSLKTQEKIFDKKEEIDFETDQNVLIDIGTDSIEEYWTKYLPCGRPLFYVKVIAGCLKLIDHRNYNPAADILYDEEAFHEEDFFKVFGDSKVTILVGDRGTGKSTLMDSLSLASNKKDYVLSCNMTEYVRELKDSHKRSYQLSLDDIFNKFERSPYKKLLNPVYNLHKTTERLLLFLDNLDEVLPLYEDAILVFIKRIIELNVRVIIASRFLTCAYLIDNLLINNIQVRSVKICDLRREDAKAYFQLNGASDLNVDDIEDDFLVNPSYLSYLHLYHREKPLDFQQIHRFDLCKMIISKIIDDHYGKINLGHDAIGGSEALNEDILNSHRLMAMVASYGKDFIIRHCNIKEVEYNRQVKNFKQLHIRMGIVRYIKDDCPVFVNEFFVQCLVMEWFNQQKLRNKLNGILRETCHNFFRKFNCPGYARCT